mgnify:CR=1 FL=1
MRGGPREETPRTARGSSRRPLRALAVAAALSPAIFAVGVTVVVERSAEARRRAEDRARVVAEASAVRARLETTVEQNLYLLAGIRAEVARRGGIDPAEFAGLTEEVLVAPNQVRHIALVRGTVIVDAFPRAGNLTAIGRDLAQIPEQREEVLAVERTVAPRIAGPVHLVQGGTALVGRVPIIERASGRYWGHLAVVMNVPAVLRAVHFDDPGAPLSLFLRRIEPNGAPGEAIGGDPALLAADPVALDISLPGAHWRLWAVPRGGWPVPPRADGVRILGAAAALLFAAMGLGTVRLLGVRKRGLRALRDVNEGLARSSDELRQARDELRAYQQQLLRIVDALPAAVAYVGADRRLVWANRGCEEYFGRPRKRLIGVPVEELAAPGAREENQKRLDRAFAGEAMEFEIERLLPHGAPAHFVVNVTPEVGADGKVVGAIVLAADRTDARRAEEERRSLQGQLERAQRLESLGVLAGGVAHDFNNLLQPILGIVELALGDLPEDASLRPMLIQVRQAAERAALLVRQMLDFAGRGGGARASLDLSRTVAEVAHLVEAAVPKSAKLELDLAPETPAIRGDAAQIVQVAMNLVINAGEALGGEGGTVRVATGVRALDGDALVDQWTRERRDPGDYAFLEVADTGCGMDEETLARIFDPFFTTKFAGRGLGLAATLGIVRGHGGLLDVKSAPGAGTTFTVYLPLTAGDADSAAARAPSSFWRGRGTVLIADDEPLVREVARRMVERLGFDALPAADGTEAAAIFDARRDDLAAALIDLTMPGLSGPELFRRIAAARPDLPVVVVSGFSEAEARRRVGDPPPAGFLQKPFEFDQLRAALRAAVERVSGAAGER